MINTFNSMSDQQLIMQFDCMIVENEHLLYQMKKIQKIMNSIENLTVKFQNPHDNFLNSERSIWSDKLKKCCEKFVVLDIDCKDIVSVILGRLENRD